MNNETIEDYYKIISLIEKYPHYTQRKIAKELGYSLGKVNYVIAALIEKGIVKIHRFLKSSNKRGYSYVLTKKGLRDKYEITKSFLKRKTEEYDRIKKEIEEARHTLKAVDM